MPLPLPSQEKSHLKLEFRPSTHLNGGDNVTFQLPGFTSGEAKGVAGDSMELGKLQIDTIAW